MMADPERAPAWARRRETEPHFPPSRGRRGIEAVYAGVRDWAPYEGAAR
jgi:hypothetical protein